MSNLFADLASTLATWADINVSDAIIRANDGRPAEHAKLEDERDERTSRVHPVVINGRTLWADAGTAATINKAQASGGSVEVLAGSAAVEAKLT